MSLAPDKQALLHEGTVIPAHPLALDEKRQLDERRQRALTRYYLAAGAGGVAVGVHTTQFEIRDHGLLKPVLELAAQTIDDEANRPILKIAGICGPTEQALEEAELAASLGYDMGLLSSGGLANWSEEALLDRAKQVADIIPIFGFYLQPAVGGRVLSYDFWRKFAEIENVLAIKTAPFNRYQTLDVVRAVCDSDRRNDIALYTGNDDNIVLDLLTPYSFEVEGKTIQKYIVGGLLGQWAVWTKRAVELLDKVKSLRQGQILPTEMLTRGLEWTDINAALFDVANDFRGCIAGLHEVLWRQGLLEGIWCLNPDEGLSPGQLEEIDRVHKAYPHLNDDAFVKTHLNNWLC